MSDNRFEAAGRLLKNTGGLFTVFLEKGNTPLAGQTVQVGARGNLRAEGGFLPGDRVTVTYGEASFSGENGEIRAVIDRSGVPDAAISRVLERKNAFIRPAMANIDRLYLILSAARPDPSELTADKLISVCEYHGVEPVVVIGKKELAPERAAALENLYASVGYRVFSLSCAGGEGVDEFVSFVAHSESGSLSAFAGASGAGKSTLMNRVFPELSLRSGDVSVKSGRGRHTTRTVEIYPADLGGGAFWIADTPGFSAIDFVNFDFLPFEALPGTMREFRPFFADCRWPDCSHTKEEDCGVVRAVNAGKIARSRFESYLEMYGLLRQKHRWD